MSERLGRAVDLGRSATTRIRAAMRSGGAEATGLTRVLDLHAVQSAADAFLTVALAKVLFLNPTASEAKGKVALYLLITMAPFAVVAPVLGPVLDRFGRGRRYAISATMVGRAVLALGLAKAVAGSAALALYPAAFGVLVLSKGYAVMRGAVIPRVLPRQIGLVQANARLSLTAVVTVSVAGPVSVGVAKLFGEPWSLRFAAAGYVVAAVLAVRLPRHVDTAQGRAEPLRLRLRGAVLGPAAVAMLRAAGAVRVLSGFLILFMAFLVRHAYSTGTATVAIGLLAVAAAVGGFAGTALGARLKGNAPERLNTAALALSAGACTVTALWFGLATALVLAVVASGAQSVGRLALDAVIQRDVPEEVRTSAMSRTDTVLQLAWVVGGGVGIALPLGGTWGFGLAAAGLTVALVDALRSPYLRRRQ